MFNHEPETSWKFFPAALAAIGITLAVGLACFVCAYGTYLWCLGF
jgi:F0F1-type ATP synthase membrane subunit c/vacuolar-type H+-ATPase subunit K